MIRRFGPLLREAVDVSRLAARSSIRQSIPGYKTFDIAPYSRPGLRVLLGFSLLWGPVLWLHAGFVVGFVVGLNSHPQLQARSEYSA